MLRLLRPKQWTKNLLLFAALLFAERLLDPAAFARACLAFVAFCLASSSIYVVNDLVDLERDRAHPEKRHRPIASGAVTQGTAIGLAAALTAAALALAFLLGSSFLGIVLLYLALSHFYSFVGKNIVLLDTLLVAIGFVVRAVAGALAIDVPYSDWFVLCTLFVALFIALSKRKAELLAGGDSTGSRPVLRHYTADSLTAFTGTSMAAAVISYSLYVQDVLEESAGELRVMILTVPFVIIAIFRYHLLVENAGAGEKPEEVLLSDRPLQLSVLGFLMVAFLAFYGVR
ncbi:MAG: decaprenyl-phosphate phosphoribosyltransferase [Myxococcota bacterium]|nr:decaprenyl-phosphate phosphoribosyltransferase [Myxococcota bacterium]